MSRSRSYRRTQRVFVSILVVVAVCAIACSPNVKQAGGLELIVATNLRIPDDFDSIQVRIQQQEEDGGWRPPVLDADYAMMSQSDLPTRFAIAAGKDPDQVVLIDVTAKRGPRPIVVHEALIQVPTDRVAEYVMRLSAKCVEMICTEGSTCDPDTGMCVSNVVDPSQLPPYTPGEMIDAGPLSDVTVPVPTRWTAPFQTTRRCLTGPYRGQKLARIARQALCRTRDRRIPTQARPWTRGQTTMLPRA